uniref:Uncharacterized protein n=1 Tax=Lepeophtheirus salmonis TaxID=72036 RepID=A0A0K2UCI7_LEPSM
MQHSMIHASRKNGEVKVKIQICQNFNIFTKFKKYMCTRLLAQTKEEPQYYFMSVVVCVTK